MEHADARTGVDDMLCEGLKAYAAKQSSIFKQMVNRFASQWIGRLHAYGILPEWPEEYLKGCDEMSIEPANEDGVIDDEDDLIFDFM